MVPRTYYSEPDMAVRTTDDERRRILLLFDAALSVATATPERADLIALFRTLRDDIERGTQLIPDTY